MYPAILHFSYEFSIESNHLEALVRSYRTTHNLLSAAPINTADFEKFLSSPDVKQKVEELFNEGRLLKIDDIDLTASERTLTFEESARRTHGEFFDSIDVKVKLYFEPVIVVGPNADNTFLVANIEHLSLFTKGQPVPVFTLLNEYNLEKYQRITF